MVKFALSLPPHSTPMWTLGQQMGVTHAITSLPKARPDAPFVWDYRSFVEMKSRFEDAGYTIAGVECNPPIMQKVKLGLPDRDEAIAQVKEMLGNMGAVGIPIWCYNWMAQLSWLRTSTTSVTRGGALVTSYDHALMQDQPLTEAGVVTEEQLWGNLAYFHERIVPVAEQARVKLAIHPDDPPVSPIRGIGRILTSVENFDRALSFVPSPYNGLTFCQGCFSEMGVDIPAAVRHFAEMGQLHFAHFRSVKGTAAKFEECFHDDGITNMYEAMEAYVEAGFDGPMRPDHVPTMAGDPNDHAGYTDRGRLYAIGYMRGLLEGVNANRAAARARQA